jgi:hypothetical protein
VKKLIAGLLCLVFVCGLSVGLTGCSKDKKDEKKATPDEKKPDEKKPAG